MSKKKTNQLNLVLLSILILVVIFGIYGYITLSNKLLEAQLENTAIKRALQIPTISQTPTTTLIPTAIPTSYIRTPSSRSMRVAGVIYALYDSEEQREKIRSKTGIAKSDNNSEIIQLALWYDKNPGLLSQAEAAIDNYRSQSHNNTNPIHCTSTGLGSSIYTDCY